MQNNSDVAPENSKKRNRRRRQRGKNKAAKEVDDQNLVDTNIKDAKNSKDQDPGLKNRAAKGAGDQNLVNTNIKDAKNSKDQDPGLKNRAAKGAVDQNLVSTNIKDTKNSKAQRPDVSDKNRKNKKKSRSRLDRYFGRFRCKKCRRTWESAFVFTRAGTKKVVFKQRCKNCDGEDAWVFPYRLELLRCSICQSDICECLCEVCDKLIHSRYIIVKNPDDDDIEKRIVDDNFDYCNCAKRSQSTVGDNIDDKKPHLAHLCQKCLRGYPCTGLQPENDELPKDNEP